MGTIALILLVAAGFLLCMISLHALVRPLLSAVQRTFTFRPKRAKMLRIPQAVLRIATTDISRVRVSVPTSPKGHGAVQESGRESQNKEGTNRGNGKRKDYFCTAWHMRPVARGPKPLVLFLHGNSGNLSTYGAVYTAWLQAGFSVLTIDPPGFGTSKGKPSEAAWYAAAEALAAEAKMIEPRSDRWIVHGFSLGTAAASHLALMQDEADPVGCLILDSGFSTLTSAVDHFLPGFGSLSSWLMTERFDNMARVTALRQTPVLFIHSTHDEVTPYHDSWAMYRACRSTWTSFYPSMQPCHSSCHISKNVTALAQHIVETVHAF